MLASKLHHALNDMFATVPKPCLLNFTLQGAANQMEKWQVVTPKRRSPMNRTVDSEAAIAPEAEQSEETLGVCDIPAHTNSFDVLHDLLESGEEVALEEKAVAGVSHPRLVLN